MAATQARPEEWDYAKPFEDMPGPKPLPIIGNVWRFIPFLGKLLFPYVIRVRSLNEGQLVRLYMQFVKCQILSKFNIKEMNTKLQQQYNSQSLSVKIIHFTRI
jgi:cytochrome P450 family 49 subfamily A